MRFLKSFFAGFIAVLLGLITILVVVAVGLVIASSRMPEGTSVGWDPISLFRQSYVWIALLLFFLIGFTWQFRRTRASH